MTTPLGRRYKWRQCRSGWSGVIELGDVRSSATRVTATVNWTVTWSGAGQGGTFPNMTTSASVAFRVAESQGIATG